MKRPHKAYYVEESRKGRTTWLVHAKTGREAREIYYREGEACDSMDFPNGVSNVRRAPEEDD